MSEAFAGVGHELLNPFGERICVSKITFRTLDMRGYLQRDHGTGLKQIKPSLIHFFLQLERTTYHRELYTVLGPDFSGPSVVVCGCHQCKERLASESDDARISGVRTAQIVKEVKARRKIAA